MDPIGQIFNGLKTCPTDRSQNKFNMDTPITEAISNGIHPGLFFNPVLFNFF